MSDTVAQFVEKTQKMAGELQHLERNMILVAAQTVKTSVQSQMAAAGVQNGKLRGVGKRGAKIGVRYTITASKALVRATGPFQLIERDTKAHRIPRERGRRAKKRYAVIPGVGVRAWAQSPGTKGKHPWEKGVVAAIPIQHKAQQIALGQSLGKVFG